jgi:ABC-2 type transport system permease protein
MTFANPTMGNTMPLRRIASAYLAETKFECLRVLRSPAFVIPILALPVGFYLLLGVAMAGMRGARQGPSDAFIFVSFLVYGMLAPGLLGVSSLLASDRAQRILEYKRALPAPFGSVIVAKLLMAIALSLGVVVLIIALAATLGGVSLTAGQFVAAAAIALAGVAPISSIGLYLSTRAAPSSVSAIAGGLLVALAILAGLFYRLPNVLDALRPIWPTYHIQQLCLAALGLSPPGHGSLQNALALLGFTTVFGFLAAKRLVQPD